MRIDARAAQTLEHVLAGQQRDLALGGLAAQQHGDLAESCVRDSVSKDAVTPSFRTLCRCAASTSCTLSDDAHFALQHRRRIAPAPLCCTCSISASISAAVARPGVDDEVGMLARDHRAADGEAFQSARLDQTRGVIAGRIAEHRAGVGLVERLRGDAPLQQLLDRARARLRRRPARAGTRRRRTTRRLGAGVRCERVCAAASVRVLRSSTWR